MTTLPTTICRSKGLGKSLFLLLPLYFLAACSTPPPPPPKEPVIQEIIIPFVATNPDQPTFDPEELAWEIENYFNLSTEGNILHQSDSIYDYYAQRDFQARWISISDTNAHREFLYILGMAERNGLLPNAYHYEQIKTNLYNLTFLFFHNNEINYALWAETELLLSDALVLLSKHLCRGVIKADTIEELNYHIPITDEPFLYSEVLNQHDIFEYFNSILPENKPYLLLQNQLIRFLNKPDSLKQKADSDTINILRVNMERCRWHRKNNGFYVYVNIPEFMLYVYHNDTLLMTSKTCVGVRKSKKYSADYQAYLQDPEKNKKPILHETPCLKSSISYLVLNPKWYTPSNIARYEILRKIQKDSNYLDRMSFLVYDNDRLIDPHSVDWKAYTPETFNFRFEQQAGEKNALGKMKFIFPNKFSVYLHDTPSKQDFSRKDRSVSHGCIRVENYLELAVHLLRDSPTYHADYLRDKLGLDYNDYDGYGEPLNLQTTNLFFNSQKHIWVDYKTAWVDDDNQLQIVPDIYSKDPVVLKLLNGYTPVAKH